jgi:hypothetical protein
MGNKPKHRLSRRTKENALEAIDTSSTKKRSASTHGRAGRPQKARKRTSSPHVDERAENVSPSDTSSIMDPNTERRNAVDSRTLRLRAESPQEDTHRM